MADVVYQYSTGSYTNVGHNYDGDFRQYQYMRLYMVPISNEKNNRFLLDFDGHKTLQVDYGVGVLTDDEAIDKLNKTAEENGFVLKQEMNLSEIFHG